MNIGLLALALSGCVTTPKTVTTTYSVAPEGISVTVLPLNSQIIARYLVKEGGQEGDAHWHTFGSSQGNVTFYYMPKGEGRDYSDDLLICYFENIPAIQFVDIGVDSTIDAIIVTGDDKIPNMVPFVSLEPEKQEVLGPKGLDLIEVIGQFVYADQGAVLLQDQYGPQ
jgi:hypothetical protein